MLRYFNIEGQYVLKYLQTVPKRAKIVENGGATCADQKIYYKQIQTWQIYHLIFKSTPYNMLSIKKYKFNTHLK